MALADGLGRKLKLFVLGSLAFGVFAGLVVVGLVFWQVKYGDTSDLRKTTIMSRIQEETSLYYLDESTRMGSIFESGHRSYIPLSEIPPFMLNAIIAAEDKNFYNHIGFDPLATAKAFMEGVANGFRFRRGGSTLTQQTVKNIVNDWEASFARKIREAIKAMQLETIYEKKQILEFYLNQFHVASNGNGIGIAAKYYFNKDVRDLNLVEASFIAGSVKGPSKYNPFIKYTRESRAQAVRNANARKNYVIRRMLEQGWISQDEHDAAAAEEVPFNRGEFRTSEVALVDLVKKQLKRKEILEALGLEKPEDLNIAGLRVFTTIDHEMQSAGQLAMRRNLSRLETILQGFATEEEKRFKPLRSLEVGDFHYCKVEEIEGNSVETYQVRVSFGLPGGYIPNESLVRYANLLDLPVGHPKGYKHHLRQLIKTIKPGNVLFCEIKEYDIDSHEAVVELQKRPLISGGFTAIDKGEVRSVISGFDTLGFNRAMQARRQPGSVFKSLVFFAGLQLGWSMLDQVDNSRQLFHYQGHYYYPRPDHATPYDKASILWSGVMSENLGSVYLAANLLDKLSQRQFIELMDRMGLAPQSGETPRDYHYRVAKAVGVQLDNEGVQIQQLDRSVEAMSPDLIFAGDQALLKQLRKIWWGSGYTSELQRIYKEDLSRGFPIKEKGLRIDLVKNNFIRLRALGRMMQEDWDKIVAWIETEGYENAMQEAPDLFSAFRVLPGRGGRPALGYFRTLDHEEIPSQLADKNPPPLIGGRRLNTLDIQAIWGNAGLFSGGGANITVNDVKVDGTIPAKVLMQLEGMIAENYEIIKADEDPYSLGEYYEHHDFRIGLGLLYLKKLAHRLGVKSRIDPVLSFPLGTNVVSVSEVAKIYQTFISGKTYTFFEDEDATNQLTFIRRIEDRFGNILYETEATEKQVVPKEYALQMREILQRVVTHGTGRRARGELYVDLDAGEENDKKSGKKIRVPAFGKTGTTNDFTTAYFAGFFPYPVDKGQPLDVENSLVLVSYVGYDRNQTMANGRIRIAGSSGALPMWIGFTKEVIDLMKYDEFVDELDLSVIAKSVWPLYQEKEATPLLVDLPRGLVIRRGAEGELEQFGLTDISNKGETFVNQFALGSSVRSTVHVPTDKKSNTWQPLRLFSPVSFKEETLPFGAGSEIAPATGQEESMRPYDASGARRESKSSNVDSGESRPEGQISGAAGGDGGVGQENPSGRDVDALPPVTDDDSQEGDFVEDDIW